LQDKWLLWCRKDLWKKRVQSNVAFLNGSTGEITSRLFKRENLPQLLSNCSPLFDLWNFGCVKVSLVFQTIGIFKPIYRQAEEVICDCSKVLH
jgi:hypothetical protein